MRESPSSAYHGALFVWVETALSIKLGRSFDTETALFMFEGTYSMSE
jgi:hypothetical protein